MKAVMLSIHPKWCEKIAHGKKTVEVRKSKPKLETPFKCYIYCTVGGIKKMPKDYIDESFERGKVIGEFICDRIFDISLTDEGYDFDAQKMTGLKYDEMESYLKRKKGYGLHISDLVIYDKPKGLRQFTRYSEIEIRPCITKKFMCQHESYDYSEDTTICDIDYDGSHCPFIRLKKPPQSWCYVEDGVFNA